MHRGNVYIQSGFYVTDQEERLDIDKVYDNENTMKIQLPQDKMMSPSAVLTYPALPPNITIKFVTSHVGFSSTVFFASERVN